MKFAYYIDFVSDVRCYSAEDRPCCCSWDVIDGGHNIAFIIIGSSTKEERNDEEMKDGRELDIALSLRMWGILHPDK
jgi:hypothetical protein